MKLSKHFKQKRIKGFGFVLLGAVAGVGTLVIYATTTHAPEYAYT